MAFSQEDIVESLAPDSTSTARSDIEAALSSAPPGFVASAYDLGVRLATGKITTAAYAQKVKELTEPYTDQAQRETLGEIVGAATAAGEEEARSRMYNGQAVEDSKRTLLFDSVRLPSDVRGQIESTGYSLGEASSAKSQRMEKLYNAARSKAAAMGGELDADAMQGLMEQVAKENEVSSGKARGVVEKTARVSARVLLGPPAVIIGTTLGVLGTGINKGYKLFSEHSYRKNTRRLMGEATGPGAQAELDAGREGLHKSKGHAGIWGLGVAPAASAVAAWKGAGALGNFATSAGRKGANLEKSAEMLAIQAGALAGAETQGVTVEASAQTVVQPETLQPAVAPQVTMMDTTTTSQTASLMPEGNEAQRSSRVAQELALVEALRALRLEIPEGERAQHSSAARAAIENYGKTSLPGEPVEIIPGTLEYNDPVMARAIKSTSGINEGLIAIVPDDLKGNEAMLQAIVDSARDAGLGAALATVDGPNGVKHLAIVGLSGEQASRLRDACEEISPSLAGVAASAMSSPAPDSNAHAADGSVSSPDSGSGLSGIAQRTQELADRMPINASTRSVNQTLSSINDMLGGVPVELFPQVNEVRQALQDGMSRLVPPLDEGVEAAAKRQGQGPVRQVNVNGR